MKSGFEHLLSGTVTAQKSRQISIVCKKHFEGKMIGRIVEAWKKRAVENSDYRKTKKRVMEHMKLYRIGR